MAVLEQALCTQMTACPNLHKFVLSPETACPKLTSLDLSSCAGLKLALIQSLSLEKINLSDCDELTKVRSRANIVCDTQAANAYACMHALDRAGRASRRAPSGRGCMACIQHMLDVVKTGLRAGKPVASHCSLTALVSVTQLHHWRVTEHPAACRCTHGGSLAVSLVVPCMALWPLGSACWCVSRTDLSLCHWRQPSPCAQQHARDR